jgi:hypothetical protein
MDHLITPTFRINLIAGAFEQSYIPYVISFSMCIGPMKDKNPACRIVGGKVSNRAKGINNQTIISLITLSCLFIFYHGN